MYHHFFGLEEQAFSIAVNPRYLYMSEQHREALAHLLYGVHSGGFVQLTGEVGTGKTTLVRRLLEQLPENTDVAMILNPMASLPELLSSICDELCAPYPHDAAYPPTVKSLTDSLHSFLLHNHAQGRNTLLLIDEAQLLSPEALEQIRLLTNLETNTTKLLNIILVGQPELVDILAQPSLRQLSQRITARFHLRPLSAPETRAYINHRLTVAGMDSEKVLMPRAIADKVFHFSGGVPRLINVICERMLLGAYARNVRTLNRALFTQAEREVSGSRPANMALMSPPPKPNRRGSRIAFFGTLLIAVSAAGVWLMQEELPHHFTAWLDKTSVNITAQASTNEPQASDEQPTAAAALDLATPLLDVTLAPRPLAHQEEPTVSRWTHNVNEARGMLAQHLGQPRSTGIGACESAKPAGFQCEQRTLQTWEDLRELDRPVVMTLITPERRRAYTTLTALDHEKALLVNDDQTHAVAWSELAQLWTGEVHYLWYRPPAYTQPGIAPGHSGESVRWLAQQFAHLDNQSEPLTRNTYNRRLMQRVEIFQRQSQLEVDGIVGAMTLQKLNQALGLEKPLGQPDPASSEHLAAVEG